MPEPEAKFTSSELSAFIEMAGVFARPEFGQAIAAVQAIAGFDVPEQHGAVFLRFHGFITEPQPEYVTLWRAEPKLEKWYHRHVNGVLGDVRAALAAAHYHKANLGLIESNLLAGLRATGLLEHVGNSGMGFGGTRKLDFEYQAFVLACRRALDYLSVALAAYFKTEAGSFRSLPKTIRAREPSAVSKAIVEAHSRHTDNLDYIMAEGRKSVRNRIAHYEFVSAGTINISRFGLMLAGGGEEIGIRQQYARLETILSGRLDRLHGCVNDMIDSFVVAARSAEPPE